MDTLVMVRGEDGKITKWATGTFSAFLQQATPPIKENGNNQRETGMDMNAFWPIAMFCFVAFGLVIAAMAVGVIFGRRSISGSCGGLANKREPDGSISCALCSNPDNACKELRERMQPTEDGA